MRHLLNPQALQVVSSQAVRAYLEGGHGVGFHVEPGVASLVKGSIVRLLLKQTASGDNCGSAGEQVPYLGGGRENAPGKAQDQR